MAHEFVGALRQKNWQVLEAEGNPLEQAVPYALVKKLLQSALRVGNIAPEDRPAVARGAGRRAFRSLARGPLRRTRPAGQRSALERSRTPAATSRDHRRRMQHDRQGRSRRGRPSCCWRTFTGSTAKARPSIEALMSLAASHPLLILLTWRTEDTPGWLARLDVRRIWLRSLDITSANALLGDLLGTAPQSRCPQGAHSSPHRPGSALHRGGRAPAHQSRRPRRRRQPVCRQGAVGRAGNSSHHARGHRIPNRSSARKRTSPFSSSHPSSGREFRRQLLTAVTGMPAAQLQSRLWSLEILDFLIESQWLASPEYEFAHDLIREVAYDSILRPQREELHRRILAALEAHFPGA